MIGRILRRSIRAVPGIKSRQLFPGYREQVKSLIEHKLRAILRITPRRRADRKSVV